MTEPLPRDDVIELLNRLGSDRDEEVLEAAREVHARITAAGMNWDELLVPDESAEEEDDGDAVESPDLEDETPPTSAESSAKNAEALALIDKLLAKSDISADLREELKGYKTDIAEGEFEERDRRYISAVYARLSKRR
jgi:hypothetical protein